MGGIQSHPPALTPFNGDSFLHGEVGRLIGRWGVEVAVETGTHAGHTAVALSLLCERVVTIEIDPRRAEAAKALFESVGRSDVVDLIRGSSEQVLDALRVELGGRRALFYLDAHWQDYWPLHDELRAIARIEGPRPVVVIHDFQVPGRPYLGFDTYKGMPLDLNFVRDGLEAVYQGACTIRYNSLAAGARRGVLFAEPED